MWHIGPDVLSIRRMVFSTVLYQGQATQTDCCRRSPKRSLDAVFRLALSSWPARTFMLYFATRFIKSLSVTPCGPGPVWGPNLGPQETWKRMLVGSRTSDNVSFLRSIACEVCFTAGRFSAVLQIFAKVSTDKWLG